MISVLIPALDPPSLAEVLEALARERRANGDVGLEVVVAGRAQDLVPDGNGLRVVPSDRALLPGAARNRAFAASRGEDVIFLDADAVPEPGWLAAFRGARGRLGDRRLLGGSVRVEAADVFTFADNLSSFHAFARTRPEGERAFLPAICLGGSRRAFEEIGPFDETLAKAEDVDFVLRARRLGIGAVFCPSMCVAHRPARRTLADVLRKARETGVDSARVRRRHRDVLPSGGLLARGWPLRLAAPAAAAAVTALAVCRHPSALKRPRAVAAVFGAKVAWCLGAASS